MNGVRRQANATQPEEGTENAVLSNGGALKVQRCGGVEFALILQEDPELGKYLSAADRRVATQLLKAPVIYAESPRWRPPELEPTQTFGLLVLDGLLGRRVRIGRGVNTELLGCGDILRPWMAPPFGSGAAPEVGWRVFSRVRLAILDERITAIIGRRAALINAFSDRLLRRARYAQYLGAIGHLTRVEDRLSLTLWHLATSWGRVTPQGIRIPFRLTHEVLGELIGAQRPSVTTAITELRRRGDLIQTDGCYTVVAKPDGPFYSACPEYAPVSGLADAAMTEAQPSRGPTRLSR